MNSKDHIAHLLENAHGEFISGEEIAQKLGVTRTAVWKAINTLKSEGYPISAVTNRGYRLDREIDRLDGTEIEKLLLPNLGFIRVESCKSTPSTNTAVKERAENGEGEGFVLCASEQTAGKGRMGRAFFSPVDTGLYMSLLLRPVFPAQLSSMITAAAAVAVCRAIEEITGKKAGIKWVNDIFIDGKKVCGILTEASFSLESGGFDYAILGIGINVYSPAGGFPPEIAGVAGAILDEAETGLKNRLCASVINGFYGFYKNLANRAFLPEYRSRSTVIGKKVSVMTLSDEVKESAFAVGIDDNCNLILRGDDGSERAVSSGEIRIRPEMR